MKVSVLQMQIILGDFSANTATLYSMFEDAMSKRPDVVLLPELWNVGFYPKPVINYADPDGIETRKLLGSLARKYQVNIVGGSIANRIGEHVYNTNYIFDRTGSLISTYHKTHLFSPSGEKEDFTPGDTTHTYTLDGVKCASVICYDLRFPELVRKLALDDIAILFVPAAWPIERLMHWQTLARARAIENQLFIVAANGSGILDNTFHLGGHSVILDPWGEILSSANADKTILHANLKLAIRSQIRSSINVFGDRRPELYT